MESRSILGGGWPLRRLVLFDVDGTLIARGDPAHLAAVDAGLRAMVPSVGVSIRDIDFDGKVDRQIVRELLQAGGIAEQPDPALVLTILRIAADDYRASWEGRLGDADLLPGVRALIERLAGDDRFALGVLTGGIRGIVETKMKRLRLDPYFPVGAFGDEVDARADLLPLAVRRAETRYDVKFVPGDVVVVGDTPHDIAAAHAGHVACLAVATGRFTVDELKAEGGDVVLVDLSNSDDVISVLQSISLASARH